MHLALWVIVNYRTCQTGEISNGGFVVAIVWSIHFQKNKSLLESLNYDQMKILHAVASPLNTQLVLRTIIFRINATVYLIDKLYM